MKRDHIDMVALVIIPLYLLHWSTSSGRTDRFADENRS